MLEEWGRQLVQGVGRMFLNPLFYWSFIVLIIAGARRIREERKCFGVKVNDYFKEIERSFWLAFLFAFILSLLSLGLGFVWSQELIYLFAFVTIILSITGSFQLLAPAYTLGITFFLYMLVLIFFKESFSFTEGFSILSDRDGAMFALLLALLMFVEAFLLMQAKEGDLFSRLRLSERGLWLGEQQVKRLLIVPVFLLIPTDTMDGVQPLLPYFQIGDTTYYITLLPFLLGSQLTSITTPMIVFKKRVVSQKFLLATITLALAVLSFFHPFFILLTVLVAIIGTEWITYKNKLRNRYGVPFFAPQKEGIRVLTTLPGSRAKELEILPGEIIKKVNGIPVSNSHEFYEALQTSGAFFKLEVLDHNQEVRFIQSAFYANDHHELGLIFPEEPYEQRVTYMLKKVTKEK